MSTPEVSIEYGDITTFDADVVALKYAQDFYGADLKVAKALSSKGIPIDELRPAEGFYRFIDTRFSIRASYALFVGVPSLSRFGYREIRDFSRKLLEILASQAPETKHLAMTIHGPGFGLDETESFLAQFAGLVDAKRTNIFLGATELKLKVIYNIQDQYKIIQSQCGFCLLIRQSQFS